MTPGNPVLGYFGPLPPAPSGVADYAAAMLAGLRQRGEVRLQASGDVNLYHLGNNRLHAEHYQRALDEPGIVILHDAMLHHLFLGMLDEAAYLEEFVFNYGAGSRSMARACWERRSSAMADPQFFRYPLLRRVAERSRLVVVHGNAARRAVLAHSPGTKVAVLPHLSLEPITTMHWRDGAAATARDRFRRQELGLRAGEVLVGVYGHLRESKRLPVVLDAVEQLQAQGIPVRLLVAGDFASEDYARSMLPRIRQGAGVIYRGTTEGTMFRRLLEAADVCVNLKYPAAGESSGIAARALALGVPLLLSHAADAEPELPAGAFVPVATGPAERHSLVESLGWMLGDRAARRAVAEAGWEWCRREMDPAAVCRTIWRLAAQCASPGSGGDASLLITALKEQPRNE